jgi:glycosyltransferase involved in cell wall biosynthesis
MNNPLFSILVANYNNGHFFKDCYQSIMAQTYSNWECIIVDDASSDNSVQEIKDIIGADTRFKIHENEKNKKCGFTKNRCAHLANGEILGFLDPDDALMPNALMIMVNEHYLHSEVSIITSKFELVDLDMIFKAHSDRGTSIPLGQSYLTHQPSQLTHFATFKKKHYQKTIGIDAKMTRAVDQDLYYKMEEQGSHMFINKVLYKYRIHENSISVNKNSVKGHYWHTYAKICAFERRKNTDIINLTVSQAKKLKSNLYLFKYRKAKAEYKFCESIYFYINASLALPKQEIILKLNNKLNFLFLQKNLK